MKPQPWSILRRTIAFFSLVAATLATPAHAAPPACSTLNMPAGRTIFAVDHSLNEVIVLDESVSPINPVCFITVGPSPTNLAVSPDPNNPLLIVENDGNATVTVVDLATVSVLGTVTLTGVATPMTANLSVSPDGTFVYVVSLPATVVAGTTKASLTRFALPVPAGASAAPILATLPTAVNGPGLGVAFTPGARAANFKAYVATEGASYAIPVSTQTPVILKDSVTGANLIAETVAVDPAGGLAYMVDASPTSSNAAVAVITVPSDSVSTLSSVTPICTFANSTTVTAPAHRAYYTCAGSNFIQAIDTSTNSQSAVGNVAVPTSGHPQGIAIPYDGVTAYIGVDDGSLAVVDIASSTVSPAVSVSTSLRAVASRPVKISGLLPLTPSVPTGKTKQFSADLAFAKGTTLTWTVNGLAPVGGVSGNSTVGTIDSSGLYTAPATIPAGTTVTIGVTSPEAPPVSNFYPLTTTVTPAAAPTQLVFITTAQTLTAAACSAAITVQSQDGTGTPSNPGSTETLALTSSSPGGTFYSDNTCTTTTTSATILSTANSATFFYKDTTAGSPTITVTGTGAFNSSPTQSETVNAAMLVFTTQPGGGTGGTAWTTQPVVTVEDGIGNPVTSSSASITLTITSGTGAAGAKLTCTSNPLAATAGVATFAGCNIDKASAGYTLTATGAGLTSATSNAFTITAGTATQLVFTTQPSGGTGGTAWATQPVVTVEDAVGNTVTSSSASILLGITSGTGTAGATLTCTSNPLGATAGVATFAGCNIDKAGNAYTLTATSSGLTSATSSAFNITVGPAAQLAFTTQPGGGTGGTAWTTQPVVTVEDAGGNPVSSSTASILLGITSGTGTAGATLTCTSNPLGATAGVATFAGCNIDKAGSNYTLGASSAGLTGTTSSTFNITVGAAAKLAFTTQPGGGTGGLAWTAQPVVTLEDAGGNTVTGTAQSVTVAIQNNAGPGGVLSGTTTVAVNTSTGLATFSGLSIDTKGTGYTLTATGSTVNTAAGVVVSTAFNITVGPAAQLAFGVQPSDTVAGSFITPAVTVQIQDAGRNVVTTSSLAVTVAIGTNPGNGTLSGTLTQNAISGVATFNNLSINKTNTTGTAYTLVASSTGLTGTTSSVSGFNITPGPAAQLVFTPQPASGALGGNVTPLAGTGPAGTAPAVSVEDTLGNVVTTDTSTVSVTISSGGAFSTGSKTTAQAMGGVATFSSLFPTIAGTFTLTASDGSLTGATINPFTLTSTIVVNITSTFTTVKIEDLPPGTDTFTAAPNTTTPNNDPNVPSLGVTWKMISCGGSAINLAPCGSVNAQTGAYTPSQSVPLAPANVFVVQATAVADPSKTAATGSITINSTVTVAVAPVSPTLGINTQTKFTATVQNDPNNLGVTWSLGACPVAPTTNPSNPTPCGTLTPIDGFNVFYNAPPVVQPNAPLVTIIGTSVADTSKTGNSAITINSSVTVTVAPVNPTLGINTQTKFTATVLGDTSNFGVTWSISCPAAATTTPANPNPCGTLTPIDGFNVFYNAPPVVQPNPPQVTITAKSVADTSKTGTSALTINSNVSVSVAIVSASIPAPATGTVAIGFSVSFAAAVTGDSSSFGVKGWSVNGVVGGNSTVGKIVATDLTHATYTAPTAVPSPAAVNVTATSVADFTKTSPSSSIQVVSDQLVYDPANPTGKVNVPAAPATSGSVVIDLQGPPNIPVSAFSCTDLDTLNGKATCTFALNPTPNLVTCPATQCTSVTLTLSVVRASAALVGPGSFPPLNAGRYSLGAFLLLLLPFAVSGFALFRRPPFSARRIKLSFALAMLLCLTLGWASACNQFVIPSTPPPPIPPTGAGTAGNLTVKASPGGSFATVNVSVPFLVQ